MAALSTRPDDTDPAAFLAAIADPRRRAEAPVLVALMSRVTGASPVIWGDAMVGFGAYDYTTASGHSGRWFLTGFRPSPARLTIHVMTGFDRCGALLARLGPHRHAKSCLYVTALDRIDLGVLEEMLADSVARLRARHGG